MIPTSARPAFRSSAHCDGTANERSYRPSRGPSVKPHTNGAVFRNSTIEMRSLPIFANARGQFTIAQPAWLPNAAGNDGRAGRRRTQCPRKGQTTRGAKTQPYVFQRDLTRKMTKNPILPIETMNLTIEPFAFSMAAEQKALRRGGFDDS